PTARRPGQHSERRAAVRLSPRVGTEAGSVRDGVPRAPTPPSVETAARGCARTQVQERGRPARRLYRFRADAPVRPRWPRSQRSVARRIRPLAPKTTLVVHRGPAATPTATRP